MATGAKFAAGGVGALVGAALTFLATNVVPAALTISRNQQDLTDSERDYFFRVAELETKQDKDHLLAVAKLVDTTTQYYIHDTKAAQQVREALSQYARAMAPAAADPSQPQGQSGQGAALAAQAQLGEALGGAADRRDGLAPTKAAQDAVRAPGGQGRVFFQIGDAGDRAAAAGLIGSLSSQLGPGWTVQNGVELVPGFEGNSQVRYFFAQDKADAEAVAGRLKRQLPHVECHMVGGYDTQGKIKPRLVEVWLKPNVQVTSAPPSATPVCG